MALEDLRDQLRERATELWGRVQETPAYNNLREKYESLSPTAQKGIKAAGIALVVLMMISIPLSYFSSSSSFDSDYESTRQLLRDLLHASRLANEASNLPPPVSPEDFKTGLQEDLAEFALLPEQIGGVEDLNPDTMGASLAPKTILQQGVAVTLKKLNLKQIVEIGYRLQGKNASVKLVGVDVRASTPDPHYFDVVYQLVIYSLPFTPENDVGPEDNSGGKGGARNIGGGGGVSKAPNRLPPTPPANRRSSKPPPKFTPGGSKDNGMGD